MFISVQKRLFSFLKDTVCDTSIPPLLAHTHTHTHTHTRAHTVQALEAAKAVGSSENAEEILDAVQEKIEAKHKEQQKQTTKINSLVSTLYKYKVIVILVYLQIYVPYSGKFSYGANFRMFRMNALHAKIKTCESLNITS